MVNLLLTKLEQRRDNELLGRLLPIAEHID